MLIIILLDGKLHVKISMDLARCLLVCNVLYGAGCSLC